MNVYLYDLKIVHTEIKKNRDDNPAFLVIYKELSVELENRLERIKN
jgi:hypothetical protein